MPIERLGPYLIQETLGHGGMGSVFAATNEITGDRVAVKMLSAAFCDQAHFRERFEAEIETLKRLTHPHIVQLYAYGVENSQPYFAMELVEGKSLFEHLRAGRKFHCEEVAQIGVEICAALRHAHDRGIIHRDLKPANLLLDPEERVKLTDFGIAKLFDGAQLTVAGGVIGTADYMAPEQAQGAAVSTRSDLYSLGSVLYSLVAGRPPFYAKTLAKVLHSLQTDAPQPIQELAPQTPDSLARIIHRLLEKDPEERIGTAQAVSNRLQEVLDEIRARREAPSLANDPRPTEVDDDFELSEDGDAEGGDITRIPHSAFSRPTAPLAPPGESRKGEPPLKDAPTRRPPTDLQTGLRAGGKPNDETPTHVVPPGVNRTTRTGVPPRDNTPTEPPTGAPSTLPPTESPSGNRFITVEEARRRSQGEPEPAVTPWGTVASVAGLGLALLAILGIGFYVMLPPSADQLFQQISTAATADDAAALTGVRSQINDFLNRFPDDPRHGEVSAYNEELEVRTLQRRQALRNRFGRQDPATPAERIYLQAVDQAAVDPSAAVAQLQALVDVFADDAQASTTTALTVELARSQIEQLAPSVAEQQAQTLRLLADRLAEAEKIQPAEPERAKRIWQGVIRLYSDTEWARPLVEQAEKRLTAAQTASEAGA
ncbi:serine/threonine-protein kinase [Lignipirellula cremea]|uniref:non-specific serine/threonine protein kinase n=1 Tax=Lignipirellula cremea TaxID=2528010 RepID=A0A518DMM5_9BACT|nr:serine/threonine-protein kinase [Lignipirellula cremea]QDU93089.1 Serine/threonine-protein kinase PrkC [Lignipirellula cremea]